MNQDQARKRLRYRNKVNRVLQAGHGYAVKVTSLVLIMVIDMAWTHGLTPYEAARIVVMTDQMKLSSPVLPTRGNQPGDCTAT